MVLACIIAGWSVSQLSSWLSYTPQWNTLLHTTLWTTFSRVSLNIYLFETAMICIKVSPLHKQIWWDNMQFLFVDGFQGEENESNNFSFGASLKASGILPVQAAAGRCYCRLCSREELSSPQVFCWTGHIPAHLHHSEPSRAGTALDVTTLDVTRSLCKQHLDSPTGSSSRNLQSTEKAKMKILSAAMATQKYWGSRCSESKEEIFSPNQGKVLPLTLRRLHSSLHFKISIAKKPKRNKWNPRFCLFLQDQTTSPFEGREHGVKFA